MIQQRWQTQSRKFQEHFLNYFRQGATEGYMKKKKAFYKLRRRRFFACFAFFFFKKLN